MISFTLISWTRFRRTLCEDQSRLKASPSSISDYLTAGEDVSDNSLTLFSNAPLNDLSFSSRSPSSRLIVSFTTPIASLLAMTDQRRAASASKLLRNPCFSSRSIERSTELMMRFVIESRFQRRGLVGYPLVPGWQRHARDIVLKGLKE